MEVNEIIECYNTLSDYAKRRVATLVKDLHSDRKNTETTASEYDLNVVLWNLHLQKVVLLMVVSRCSDVLYVRNDLS